MGRYEDYPGFVIMASPRLFRTAFLLTNDTGHAEDLVQVALLKAYLSWDRVWGVDEPLAYVRKILYRSFLRSRRRPRVAEFFGSPPEALAEPYDASWPDRQLLFHELSKLPGGQRAVLVLRYFDDLSVAEVAEILNCSPGTVKSRTARALATLRLSPELTQEKAN